MSDKIMKSVRKNLLYGNCKVFSKTGDLMFLCLEKKARWYLDRNLADVITENPLSIKLNFNANGNGWEGDLYYLTDKENRCVVCGDDTLVNLTKHHVIPREYKKHLPIYVTSKQSHDIVTLCKKHHIEYECYFAIKLKKELGERYGIDYNKMLMDYNNLKKSIKMIKMLIDNAGRIPYTVKKAKISNIKIYLNKKSMTYNDIYALSLIDEKKIDFEYNKLITNNLICFDDYQKFFETWRKNFVESMNPQYLPKYWDIYKKLNIN